MTKNPWVNLPKPSRDVEPASHLRFGSAPWTPASELSPDQDCGLCLNGAKLTPDVVCGACLRSTQDELIAQILAFEGLPPKETPESLRRWESLPDELKYPARKPIPLKNAA